jgi:hypothetical protein
MVLGKKAGDGVMRGWRKLAVATGLMLTLHVGAAKADSLGMLRLQAEHGDAAAQFLLGDMYHEGKGVAQDYKAAVEWYRKAAEQGDAHAQFALGSMYYLGSYI